MADVVDADELMHFLADADEAIHKLPPTYPNLGHQYVCGFQDGKYAAAAVLRKVQTALAAMRDKVI